MSCDKCDYQCKKENTLNKDRNTKHEPQACKVCESPSMVDMLKHVADKHSKKPVQIGDIKEKIFLKKLGNTKKSLKHWNMTILNVLRARNYH